MNPTLWKVPLEESSSFNFKIDSGKKLLNQWHYHPEMEIVLIKNSGGTRIIGDNVQHFGNNDLILIGPNLPHAFIHDPKFLEKDNSKPAQAYVIHFRESFLGNEFLSLPELNDIKKVLAESKRGLLINAKGKKQIIPLMERMEQAHGIERILLLLHILKMFTQKNIFTPLVSHGFVINSHTSTKDEDRLNIIYKYTAENFDQMIRIEEVAELVSLTKESFCRFFKSKTQKTFFEFLIEFRIGNACRLLIENKMPVKDIGYSCGYDNISNFYHQFKSIMKKSPIQFQQEYFQLASQYDQTD